MSSAIDNKWFKTVFLKYLKRAKGEKHSYSDHLTVAFRLNKRSIETFKCVQNVSLKGALWVDSKPIEGLIERRVLNMKKGSVAWIRDDEDESFITLENKFGCINIDRKEWNATFKRCFEPRFRNYE